jgi:hypothetical protein
MIVNDIFKDYPKMYNMMNTFVVSWCQNVKDKSLPKINKMLDEETIIWSQSESYFLILDELRKAIKDVK